MVRVIITKNDGAIFQGSFPTKQAAEAWVSGHKAKGKDAVIIHSHEKIVGAKTLGRSKDFTGKEIIKQELPAEYKVEYIEEHLHDRDNKIKELIKRRDLILKSTDWLFIADVPTPQKHKKIFMEYRQLMRDLPRILSKSKDVIKIEEFEVWLRRLHPEEFMDGGDADTIIHRFTYYYKQ